MNEDIQEGVGSQTIDYDNLTLPDPDAKQENEQNESEEEQQTEEVTEEVNEELKRRLLKMLLIVARKTKQQRRRARELKKLKRQLMKLSNKPRFLKSPTHYSMLQRKPKE